MTYNVESVRTAAGGTFTVGGLTAGAYKMFLAAPGTHGPSTFEAVAEIEIGHADHIEGLRLELDRGKLSIAGQVKDSRGRPLRAIVQVDGPRREVTESDSRGRYRFEGVLEGEYTIVAMDSRTLRILARDEVAAGNEDFDLIADELANLAGRVVDRAR